MTLKKFEKKDILYNILETTPKIKFDIYDSIVYYNNRSPISGAFTDNIGHIPSGHVSLYEMNVDRPSTSLIYPFIYKDGSSVKFKKTSTTSFAVTSYGSEITGSYPLSASITRDFAPSGPSSGVRPQLSALKNTLNFYSILSKEYTNLINYERSSDPAVNIISIPSIFYGSSIKKGTVDLKFYVSGTLIGQLQDEKQNGELIQVGPSGSIGSASCAGVILYNEGFVLLTGSWALSSHTEDYDPSIGGLENPSWIYYAVGANDDTSPGTIPSSSYSMEFLGRNYTPTLMMFANIEKAQLNHSNNSTYLEYGQNTTPLTGTYLYEENPDLIIKNTVSSSFIDPSGSFEKITYISKIGIYDKDKNLIGVASVAKPVKKTLENNLTFKLKVDI
jgi:hypothetical protein